MVTFESKLNQAHQELMQSGIWKTNYKPVPLTLIRRLGFEIKPPHYRQFLVNFFSYSVILSCLWGIIMWFLVGSETSLDLYTASLIIICAGLLCGFTMAIYYKLSARYHHLSNWKDFN
ncbi:DUF6404 family protein [Psychromonas ossibalaenae]|uniref:DUF6404 family protein n=1 Tax=Psychromonas ossibalaenae TaxID=444922 RepID=UPI00036FF745